MPQRQEYHWTRSIASSTVSTATVVNNSHSMGSTSAGGSTSQTCTAHSVTAGKPSRLRCCGGTQGQGTKAQRQRRFPGGLRAATRDVQEELGRHGLGRDRVPHIPLRRVDTAIPRGANQQIDARRAGSRQDVIHIGFPIADADHVGRGTAVARGVDGVETVEPLLTFLLADGELLAPGPFPHVVRVPGPDLLGQEPQGDPLRRDGQGGMDQQAVTRGMPSGPKPSVAREFVQLASVVSCTAKTKGTALRRL